ncbi:MAG: hypothetical protein HY928_03180, partial [Elusimicrobia bacterium]|nr:hypothetical protein [Elusimicrobiota bacterium]
MDRLLKGAWALAKGLFELVLGLVFMGLLGVGMGLVFWAGESAVAWVKAPRDCSTPTRPVSELLVVAEGGHLFARRAALYELPCAVPKTPSELDLLAAAGRQAGRKRLRVGALASIRRVGAQEAALAPRLRALLAAGDPAVEEAAFDAARNLGLGESHPDLAAFLARRPDLRRAPAAAAP